MFSPVALLSYRRLLGKSMKVGTVGLCQSSVVSVALSGGDDVVPGYAVCEIVYVKELCRKATKETKIRSIERRVVENQSLRHNSNL
jgi:hypothetical protein